MKTETFIKRYAEKHKTPDQEYCPHFGIEWKGKNKKLGAYRKIYTYWDGKIYINEAPKYILSTGFWRNTHTPSTYGYYGLYAKNIGHNILEIATVKMYEGGRGKEGEIREWKYFAPYYNNEWSVTRFFIDGKTMMPYNEKGERIWKSEDGKFYNRYLVKKLRSIECVTNSPNRLAETLQEFCGKKESNIGWQGRMKEIRTFWCLSEYIRKVMERPKSDIAIKLSSYDLPERNYSRDVIEFSIIDDTYAVFRLFQTNDHWDTIQRKYVSDGDAIEFCRVFVNNKGKVTIMDREVSSGNFKVTGVTFNNIVYWHNTPDQIGFHKLQEWKPIKWNMEIINNEKSSMVIKRLVKVLRHPIIEKFYKMGYENIANFLLDNDVNATLKEMFYLDEVNEKERSIYKMLGVNKYMFDVLNEQTYQHSRYVRPIKEIFNSEDISSLSKETIDLYVNGLSKMGYSAWENIIGRCTYRWNHEKFSEPVTDKERNLIEKLFRIEKEDSGIIRAYVDSRNTYNYMSNKPEIDWYDFRHTEDVITLHNNLIALKNAEDEERRRLYQMREEERRVEYQKKFEKLQEDRIEKFESHGEKYSIIIPKDLTEITTEGMTLHHCVGGYLDRHAQGNTNILFLRDNSNIDKPFYTIEVDPSGYVVQIHGNHNRWLGNDPSAISFVWKWIQDRNFRCEKYKLLNTGAGYGKGKGEVSESYLVA